MKRFSDLQIHKQFFIFFSLIFIVPLIIFGLMLLTFNQKNTEREVEELVYLADINERRVTELVDEFQASFEAMSEDTVLLNAITGLYIERSEQNQQILNATLDTITAEQEYLSDAFILDSDGLLLSEFNGFSIGSHLDNFEFFQDASINKKLTNFSANQDSLTAYISSPLYGVVRGGVIVAEVDLSPILDLQKNYEALSQTGEFQLVRPLDGGGAQLITPPRDPSEDTQTSLVVDEVGASSPYALSLIGSEGIHQHSIDYRGERVFAATVLIDELSWGLILKKDFAEIINPVFLLAYYVIFSIILILLLLGVLAYSMGHLVIEPIINLTFAAKKIEKGEFVESDIPDGSNNETGILARSFKHMAGQLLSANQVLERTVKKRTASLRRTLSELKRAKAKDHALLLALAEGTIATDIEGKIVLVNKSAEKMLGMTEAQLKKIDIYKALMFTSLEQEEIVNARHPVRITLRTKAPLLPAKYTLQDRAGEYYPVLVSVSPILLDQAMIGAVVTFRDITKEQQMDKMKTEFISIASHQLRGPLASLLWYGQLMEKGELGDLNKKQTEFIKRMNISAKQLNYLVDGFLNVSRIESGKVKNDPRPTRPVKLLKNILGVLEREIQEKKLKITIQNNTDKSFASIEVDTDMLREVYMNLVTNAVKYTPEKGEVNIICEDNSTNFTLRVKDSGIGIDEKDKEKIFSKFFRGDKIIEKGLDGTGLGLYTAKMLTKEMGGEIGFSSKINDGSTFWVSIPKKPKI